MGYSEKQANEKARQIYKRFAGLIHLACANSSVPEDFLAGFIGVEAGIDRQGQIREEAVRFEPGVYQHLLAVRDGLQTSYNRIKQKDIAEATEGAIRNLATSWGLSQIMGWHLIHNLQGTIADLRDPDKHLHYTVQLLMLTAGQYIKAGQFASVLRIWNTGSANGKTYHDDYVDNAKLVSKHYRAIAEASRHALVSGLDDDFSDSAVELPAVSQPETPNPLEPHEWPAVDQPSQSQPPISQPAGDAPDVEPSHWFNVEDYKPLVLRWLKRIWGGIVPANIGQGGINLTGVFKDPEHWYIYAAIAVGIFLLLIFLGVIASTPLLVFWLWNRREILHLKSAQLKALADPGMKNIGLIFEKK